MDDVRREPFGSDFRVTVDPSQHALHDDAQTVRAFLRTTDGTAEVQIARTGDALVVIVAGAVETDRDARGHPRLRVRPT